MIICEVNKNHLNVRTRELLTAGSQNVNTVEFRFNEAWDGLAKTATFKTSKKTISVLLGTNTTKIPWEVLADAGEILAVGVFGVSGETIVLPTVWGILGKVMDAAHLGDEEKEPTPDVYQKILDELNSLEKPTWDSVQNKPFSTLGSGLEVDENGVLSAEGGGGGSSVFYINIKQIRDDTNNPTFSADKTAAEIYEALNAKVAIYAVFTFYKDDKTFLPIYTIDGNTEFTRLNFISPTNTAIITLTSDNGKPTIVGIEYYVRTDYAKFRKHDNEDGSVSIYADEGTIVVLNSPEVVPTALYDRTNDKEYSLSNKYYTDNTVVYCFDDIIGKKVRKVEVAFGEAPEAATLTYSEEPLSTSVNITYDEKTGNLQIGG